MTTAPHRLLRSTTTCCTLRTVDRIPAPSCHVSTPRENINNIRSRTPREIIKNTTTPRGSTSNNNNNNNNNLGFPPVPTQAFVCFNNNNNNNNNNKFLYFQKSWIKKVSNNCRLPLNFRRIFFEKSHVFGDHNFFEKSQNRPLGIKMGYFP